MSTASPLVLLCLGPLECWSGDRQVDIRGTIQSTLLAALLAAESRPLSLDVLIRELWGEQPPATAANALQAHVSRLRRKLNLGERLLNLPSGYRLVLDGVEIDAGRFLEVVAGVRGGGCADPRVAAQRLRDGLALWRGPVFGGLAGGALCQAAVARYETARSVAETLRYDLELRSGKHTEVVPELSEAVEAGFNERSCEQLMVALYRSGLQTEALRVYRRMRERLDTELGVHPSPSLRGYERAILEHHPAIRTGGDHTLLRG